MERTVTAVLSATLLAVLSSRASAAPVLIYGDVLYSNGAQRGNSVAHRSDNSGVPTVVADRFTLDAPIVVGGVVLWGGYLSADGNYPPDDFTFAFYEDEGGLPGAEIARSSITEITRTDTRHPSRAGITIFRHTGIIGLTPLASGTYWFSVVADTFLDPDEWVWFESKRRGPLAETVDPVFPDPTWHHIDDGNLAFALLGPGRILDVPEASSVLLSLCALSGLWLRRRRALKRSSCY
jgi:hypothetical protein